MSPKSDLLRNYLVSNFCVETKLVPSMSYPSEEVVSQSGVILFPHDIPVFKQHRRKSDRTATCLSVVLTESRNDATSRLTSFSTASRFVVDALSHPRVEFRAFCLVGFGPSLQDERVEHLVVLKPRLVPIRLRIVDGRVHLVLRCTRVTRFKVTLY